MDRRRWHLVESLCRAAAARDPGERATFLDEACRADADLRREVESLLAEMSQVDGFLETPAWRAPTGASTSQQVREAGRPFGLQFPAWPIAALGLFVVLRASIFALALLTESWSADPDRFIPAWGQILQATLFASLAAVLLVAGRGDRRAWALGVFILDSAGTLLEPFVRAIDAPSPLATAAMHLRTDAFQAAFVWNFASAFPRQAVGRALARTFFWATALALALGALLLVVDTIAQVQPAVDTTWSSLVQALRRESPGADDWYFTLQFLSLVPLFVAMPLKLRECGPNDRRRFIWLGLGIIVGFTPLVVDVLLLTMWPGYATVSLQPPLLRIRGLVILVSLSAIPIAASYAAFVQRALDVGWVLRRALQYLLVRSVIRALAVVPFVALVALVVQNRNQPVASLVWGPTGFVLGSLTVAGLVASMTRHWLVGALDRRFFRRQADVRATLLAVTDAVRRVRSLDNVQHTLEQAVGSSLHPATMLIAVAGTDDRLYALRGDLPALSRRSPLAHLLAGSDDPFDLNARTSSVVARLPADDLEWLESARAAILVPLRSATNALAGVVALGEKKSELPYTDEDRRLLAALGSAVGLALDRLLADARDEGRRSGPVLTDPPADECSQCGLLLEPDSVDCPCGGLAQRCSAPRMLADRLRFERRVGSGGMGVVYLAVDVRLQQPRAVKTLLASDPVMVTRLRNEARLMAAVEHPHLATVHGLEVWQGSPMLVMEYLEGGTLAQRLRRGCLPVGETLDLGRDLAGALTVLHRAGLLHRDVKPSNIGFTARGVAKLLDFGLAKLFPLPSSGSTHTDAGGDPNWAASLLSESGGIHGTPAYLSPEILRGERSSPRDDLWSLAVTLLEACTGCNPFRAATVAATVARVLDDGGAVGDAAAPLPGPVRQLFAELLGPRDARPQSARLFGHRIETCLTNEGG